jgi:hypothetical protein
MLMGNVLLLSIAGVLVLQESRSLGLFDAAYGAIALSLGLARYADIVRFDGSRADGTPATNADLMRYAFRLSLVSAVVWMVVRALPLLRTPINSLTSN